MAGRLGQHDLVREDGPLREHAKTHGTVGRLGNEESAQWTKKPFL